MAHDELNAATGAKFRSGRAHSNRDANSVACSIHPDGFEPDETQRRAKRGDRLVWVRIRQGPFGFSPKHIGTLDFVAPVSKPLSAEAK